MSATVSPYETLLGQKFLRQIAEDLSRVDESVSSTGFVKSLMRHAYEHVGDAAADKELLIEAVRLLLVAFKTQHGSIKLSASGWLRKTFVTTLKDQIILREEEREEQRDGP
jgi:hypothetical protein